MRVLVTMMGLALASVCSGALADSPQAADSDVQNPQAGFDISEIMAQMGGSAVVEGNKKKDSPFPAFDKVTKDMESSKGMFTLWSYKKGAKEENSEKLLCQIPSSMMGQKFMLSTSFSGGGFFTGFPLDERVVQWEMRDRQLVLIEPETRFVVNKSKEIADVVRRTHPDRIRVAVPIVTKTPGGDPLIDFGRLLKSNFADIGWMSMTASFFGQAMGGSGINSSLSKWTKKKTFPQNVEIGVELAISSFSPPGSYDKKLIHYSFWKLPKTGYSPRVADDRIGYFLTTNQDWSKPTDARDLFNRYVNRWQLEKRDPSLAMCEPKQPIVFYIEKTVPVRFRRAVRDGILDWNKAYEKIGFLNAIEVRQQTADNEWKDLDPEDMRYSFFRWIVAGAGFAMGPSRANPFTGQIYDADIIFDDAMVRHYEQTAQRMLSEAAITMRMNDPARRAFLEKFPQWNRPTSDWEQFTIGKEAEANEKLRTAMRERMRERGGQFCEYTDGMRHQMAVSRTLLEGQPKETVDRLLYEVIKQVVTHEVGHTLGLRHNFKASSIYSVEEIAKRRTTGEPTCGSVMDYSPVLFFANDTTEGHFVTPTIGPYDYWAIEYGYRPFDQTYKSHKKPAADGAEETEEADAEGKTSADDTPEVEVTAVEMEMPEGFNIDDLPPEILAQIPDEVKAMIAKGGMKMAGGPPPGGNGKTNGSKKNGGSFATPVAGEEGMLKDIASRSTEPELAYATDEDTTFLAPDPRVNRFDMGSDPIEWADARLAVVDERMANLLDWAVKDGESWYHLRSAFQTLMLEKLFVLDYVGRYIGGQYFSRAHRGESEEAPFVLVDADLQRRALAFLTDTVFSDTFYEFSPEVLNRLAPSRWSHQGSRVSYTMDYPVRRLIGLFQWWALSERLYPNVMRRIHDSELKADGDDLFTLAEYIRTLQAACWDDALDYKRVSKGGWSDAKPFVSDVRRSLQREYLGLVEPLVRLSPGRVISPDIHAMLKLSLRNLADKLESAVGAKGAGKLDFASRAHLMACKSRIERMLDPELKEYY